MHGKDGDLLIDTGLLQHKIICNWIKGFNVKYVFLTHGHADHDWNAARFQAGGAKILLSEKDKGLPRHFMTQAVNPTLPKYKLRNMTQWFSGSVFKSPKYTPDILIGDEPDLLKTLGFVATIIPLPGHTYGSLGILSGDILYCGDAFTALWKKPDITPHAVSIEQMRSSLNTMLSLKPEWLACGHGLPLRFEDAEPVIRDYLNS